MFSRLLKVAASIAAALTGPTTTVASLIWGAPGMLGDAQSWYSILGPAWVFSLAGVALLVRVHWPEIQERSTAKKAVSLADVAAHLENARMKAKSPIEIRFDPSNPGGRFWSKKRWKSLPENESYPGTEYRFEVRNSTDTILRGVFVSVDIEGNMPGRAEFIRTGEYKCDIAPGHSEFVIGFFAGDGTDGKCSATLIAGAENATPLERRFQYDPDHGPALISL